MEPRFWPCLQAIKDGDTATLETLIVREPSLAAAPSSFSHPCLLQALILDGVELDPQTQRDMAQLLLDYGSPIDAPFISTGSLNNVVLAKFLAGRGAIINGQSHIMKGWCALEESLYWQNTETAHILVEHGATLHNLRIASGIGNLPAVRGFFAEDGSLKVSAGTTNYPWGEQNPDQVTSDTQEVINNALVYAASSGQIEVVELLLSHGADVNSIPLGFHFRGSALHNAAIHGRTEMCKQLVSAGASKDLEDLSKDRHKPAGWARHANHAKLAEYLAA